MTEINAENYFLKYAYPCSHILCTVRREIDQKRFDELKQAAIENKPLNKEVLEKIFHRAFTRIVKLAQEMNKDKWDIEVIREYFRVRHNPVLDESDYPESFKEMCKVHEGTVVAFEEDEIIVQYENKKRKVKKDYLPNIKIGEKVTIHWDYAIEKIN